MQDSKMVVVAGKVVEAVNVDGQWFVEKDGDFVPYVAASRSGSFMGEKVTFVEGETYPNYNGEVKVMWLKAETMVVEYVAAVRGRASVGQVSEYPIRAQIETVVKAKAAKKVVLAAAGVKVFEGNEDMFTAGWLAANGRIGVLVSESKVEKLEEEYEAITGEKPEEGVWKDKKDGHWGQGWYVSFKEPSEAAKAALKFPKAPLVSEDGWYVLWSKEYVKGLLSMGMRMGKNDERVGFIAKGLAKGDVDAFVKGIAA